MRTSVQELHDRPRADVLIIGGGINGIATLRELALQGVDVALVERDDFVSGASAASSHMVHGGIRYLENGEFRLVKEAVTERNRLLRNAPHLVRPLPTTIPMFKTFSGIITAPFRLLVTHGTGQPRERGALLIRIGLAIYDTFSRAGGQVPRHRFHARDRSLREFPALNHTVRHTATYYDALMPSPERLALDVLHDGLAAGARAANYVAAVGVVEDGAGVRLRDAASGKEFDFEAPVVINASGPWVDLTNDALDTPTRFMGGTKGSHIVLDHPDLLAATRGHEIFFEHSDGRVVLICPIGDRVMVGTTDIPADPRTQPVCTSEEVDYFIDLVHHVFPGIEVNRSQIVFTFSGIRPLPHADDIAPGFVSRDYRIETGVLGGAGSGSGSAGSAGSAGSVSGSGIGSVSGSGSATLFSLVGGKWTTFRASAEHLANKALRRLGARRNVTTGERPIGGGLRFPSTAGARRKWVAAHAAGGPAVHSHARVEQLLERYGTRAANFLASALEPDVELDAVPGYSAQELAWLATDWHVAHLEDLVLRRTTIAFTGAADRPALKAVAEAIGPALGWSMTRTKQEVARAARVLRENHAVPE